MHIKLIKTESDHEAALSSLMALMDANPAEGTPEADEIDVLATLIEKYEEEHFPIDLPDPVEAIRFRMDQQGLSQRDLIPYIGSAARVSDILNRRRPLSLSMIRALHKGLGIPAEVLICEPDMLLGEEKDTLPWEKFPLAEMLERGYFSEFSGAATDLKIYAEELVKGFFKTLTFDVSPNPALLRSNMHQRSGRQMDKLALYIWQLRVQQKALMQPLAADYQGINKAFMQRVTKQSWSEQGPLLAKELLNRQGIHLVIEPHFKKTYLDGAVMWGQDGKPIVALTVRHDRLDNFWFTLLHELSHLHLHLDDQCSVFFDDLRESHDLDDLEKEADDLAKHTLISEEIWQDAGFHPKISAEVIHQFAREHEIHAAIVAGRIQFEAGDYRCHSKLLGRGEVTRLLG